MSESGRVLVLDGEGQSALSIIRSLGRRGIPITAAASSPFEIGPFSKYASETFIHSNPDESAEVFLGELRNELASNDYFAVIPVTDKMTALVAKHKRELETTGTIVAAEDWETFLQAYDKANTFALAQDLDIPCPATIAPSSLDELDSLAEQMEFPAVIKSRSKSVWDDDAKHRMNKVDADNYVNSKEELREAYTALIEANPIYEWYPPLVQEYIPGETQTTVLLADEGEVLAHFQERRLRTTPAKGGNSTLLEGVRSPKLLEYAETLIEALGWTGPAQVEFMKSPDGEYYLIEMNGRYWGSLPLAINSGVDFPWLHFQLLCGERPNRVPAYRTDVKQRRLFYGDIKWLLEHLSERRVSALGPFCKSFVDSTHTFVDADDPKPTAVSLLKAGALGGRRLADAVLADGDRNHPS